MATEKPDPVSLPLVPHSHATAPTWLKPWCRRHDFVSSQHAVQSQSQAPHWGCATGVTPSFCRRTGCQGNFHHAWKEGGSGGGRGDSSGLAITGCGHFIHSSLPLLCFLQKLFQGTSALFAYVFSPVGLFPEAH